MTYEATIGVTYIARVKHLTKIDDKSLPSMDHSSRFHLGLYCSPRSSPCWGTLGHWHTRPTALNTETGIRSQVELTGSFGERLSSSSQQESIEASGTNKGDVPNQRSLCCMDPEPYSVKGVHMCGRKESPLLGLAIPDSHHTGSRDSLLGSQEVCMKAAQKRSASVHSWHTAAGPRFQQSRKFP
jgi:hypothetical protein